MKAYSHQTISGVEFKFCPKCKLWKEISCYGNRKKTWDLLYENCKDCVRIYTLSTKDRKKKYDVLYTYKNKERISKNKEKYRLINKDKIKKCLSSPTYLKRRRDRRKELMKDSKYALKEKLNARIRTSINKHLKGYKNQRSWEDLLGYTWEDLRLHLQNQFSNGMTWKDFLRGKIHIDHIKPISSFNFQTTDDEFKKCWSLSNLQPLWEIDNLKKKDKILM